MIQSNEDPFKDIDRRFKIMLRVAFGALILGVIAMALAVTYSLNQ